MEKKTNFENPKDRLWFGISAGIVAAVLVRKVADQAKQLRDLKKSDPPRSIP